MRTIARTMNEPCIGRDFKRWIAVAALAAATAMAMGGCAYVMPTEKLEKSPQDKWYSDDLPVPQGFVLDKQASRVFDRGPRDYRLVYRRESYIDADRAEAFYKDAFPARGWQLKFIYGLDKRQMIFCKDDEECRVTLARNFGDAYVWAVVEVEPKDAQGATATGLAKKAD